MAANFTVGIPLPEELVCHALSFLSVGSLLTRVSSSSKRMNRLSMGIIGANEGNKTDLLLEKEYGVELTRVEPVPALATRYRLLQRLYETYGQLSKEASRHSIRSISPEATVDQEPLEEPSEPSLFRVLETLCFHYAASKFGKVVTLDDRDVQIAAGVKLLEYKRHLVPFYQFVYLHDTIRSIVTAREKYLLDYFAFPGEGNEDGEDSSGSQSPRKRARTQETRGQRQADAREHSGKLTKFGLEMCDQIFDFFDADNDNLLGWEELSAINQAAGLPLSLSAYLWVQTSYETGAHGRLTRTGYQQMFLENFVRVPRLMYKDLVRLTAYLEVCDRPKLISHILAQMQHNIGRAGANNNNNNNDNNNNNNNNNPDDGNNNRNNAENTRNVNVGPATPHALSNLQVQFLPAALHTTSEQSSGVSATMEAQTLYTGEDTALDSRIRSLTTQSSTHGESSLQPNSQ